MICNLCPLKYNIAMEKQGKPAEKLKACRFILYTELTSDPAVAGLYGLLSAEDAETAAGHYAAVLSAVLSAGCDSLNEYLLHKVLHCDNAFSRAAAAGLYPGGISGVLLSAAEIDLKTIDNLSRLSAGGFIKKFGLDMPAWASHGVISFSARDIAGRYREGGCGALFGKAAFTYDAVNKKLLPVRHADPIRIESLKGYHGEKQAVISNTESFIKGYPAQNVLLYGDRGTGKSSTVHAVLNKFSDKGLRLIELSRCDIYALAHLLDILGDYPYKFIIFIDDLSFDEEDGDFAVLKAVLEGSVRRSRNALIYATSNRRHLVRESFSGRAGDDVHAADTKDQLLSLSDRFGLTVTFINPDKAEYLKIARQIANERGIQMSDAELYAYAERFALIKGGRSPRVAKQLADIIESAVKLKKEIILD